jgi:processive 1,2-diacylglycerol beta-glucosyltransferase
MIYRIHPASFRRVLIMSASAGNGHVKAAQAVEEAVRKLYGDVEVKNIDAFKYITAPLRKLYSDGYIHMVNNMPASLGMLYDHLDKPWQNEKRRLAFHRANAAKLTNEILAYQPDLVISTHFLPAEIVSSLLCRQRINCASAIVVTDFDAHAMWLCRHYDRFFVALDETRVHLSKLGIEAENISVSGIPISPVFAQPKSKLEMRQRYGLHIDRPTILLSAGGFGVGPMEQILNEMLQLTQPVQVIALCGKNAKLKERIQALGDTAPSSLKLLPVAYTDKVDEYMSASDILLGKPGGLTTCEGLAKELAFVIVKPIPGQEERNSDHLLENGVAIRCNNLPALSFKLDRLLGQPERIRLMQKNAGRLARPLAAEDIVSELARGHNYYGGTVSGAGHSCRRSA